MTSAVKVIDLEDDPITGITVHADLRRRAG